MNIAVLGSTGSIGQNVLKVADSLEEVTVYGITANTEIEKLTSQVNSVNPKIVVIADREQYKKVKESCSFSNIEILAGQEGIWELVSREEVDLVVNGLSGIVGLKPTILALSKGKKVAIANKESIVMGWNLIKENLQFDDQLIPVDSEHSAIFQALKGEELKNVSRIVLTASGGAVYHKTMDELENVTAKDCLAHPIWDMGSKITIDSATLMNKGLEVIEAHNLFCIEYNKIDTYIHPQSILHGMVEYIDGTILAYLATADMKLPIQYALTHPGREISPVKKLSLKDLGILEFWEPDTKRFPCLDIAIKAGKTGNKESIILCAADEVAVDAFIRDRINFFQIPEIISEVLEKDINGSIESSEGIEYIYMEAKKKAQEIIN